MRLKQKTITLITRMDWRTFWRDLFLLTLGGVILAFNFNIFMAPSNIAPGGIAGLVLIVTRFVDLPNGLTMFLLNLPLMVLGFYYLGRFNFLLRTSYVMLIYNLGIDVVAPLVPPGGITDELLLNALYGGVLGGIGIGLVYRGRGTSPGTNIPSRIVQLKTGIPVSQLYMVVDGSIIVALAVVFGWERALYGLIMLFVWGLSTDYVLEGPSVIRTIFVVTDAPEKVTQAAFERLGVGMTAWSAQGMFTRQPHTVLFCTVSRPDVHTLREAVLQAAPGAFVVVGHGHQVQGGVVPHTANLTDVFQKEEADSS